MYLTESEIASFRKDTPGCNHCIHLNSAGASLMPAVVLDAIRQHIDLEGRIGGYEASAYKEEAINQFYISAAQLLKTQSRNIAFTANATDSFSRAISSIPFKKGDVILTTNEDYISNQITYLSFARRFGIKIVRAKSLNTGGVDLVDFEKCLKQYNPRLVAVTHIPTNSGLIQPVKEIGDLCDRHDTLYLLDACQSIGQTTLHIPELKCDFLSVTSRKFLRGPRGAGFLYVSDRVLDQGLEPLFIDMRGADWVAADIYIPRDGAIRFEDWEFAYALLLGTGAAIDYLLEIDMTKIQAQVQFLSDYLRKGLQKIDGVSVQDKGPELGGLVTFHLKDGDADQIKNELGNLKINVVTSIRNFAVIDYDEKCVPWTIRVSPHYFNTVSELEVFLGAVEQIALELKK